MKINKYFFSFLILLTLFIGFFWGKWGIFILEKNWHKQNKAPENIMSLFQGMKIYDLQDSIIINRDILLKKEKNLFVFWSPVCKYCKDFWLNSSINDSVVGVFGIPLTDDIDYVNYFITKNSIVSPQIVTKNNEEFQALQLDNIDNVPQFWIVDNNGLVLKTFVGAKDVDEMVEYLFNDYLNHKIMVCIATILHTNNDRR